MEEEERKRKGGGGAGGALVDRVYHTYLLMHTNQTVEFVQKKNEQYGGCNLRQMTIMEALELLDNVVDESDPDVDFPNSYHAYQTAEGIREKHPEKDWFHLVGLLHDLGKILALSGEPQVALRTLVTFFQMPVRDTDVLPFYLLRTKYGMYQPHCGLENVLMSWGHDEYMYQVMKKNKFALPEEAYYMVRFHSFYPWHTGGDYMHLCNTKDLQMLPWVQEFNKFDLYTKCEQLPDPQQLKPYYESLIAKYCPGHLDW
uniref:Inositol oxygenase n=1 Tax=Pseudonaja textilis TaxID=8673 RepID=A0A670ZCF1_PSETE